jgi:hypothetical protein
MLYLFLKDTVGFSLSGLMPRVPCTVLNISLDYLRRRPALLIAVKRRLILSGTIQLIADSGTFRNRFFIGDGYTEDTADYGHAYKLIREFHHFFRLRMK